MDDLIVIILTLIVAGIGALGQIKKKKQQAPVENGEPKTRESLWDLFQGDSMPEQTLEDPEHEEYDYEQYEEPVVQKVEVKAEVPKYQFAAQNEGKSNIEVKSPMKIEKPTMKSSIRKDFSLRKAVIYSEILNRKYS